MEFTSLLNTSLNLNLRPLKFMDDSLQIQKQADHELVESNFLGLGGVPILTPKQERVGMIDEINRLTAENKKLTDVLTVMCENYTELRNQLMEQTSAKTNNPSKKRKTSATDHESNNVNGVSESSSTDEEEEDSFKKQREEHLKTKISRTYTKTEPSDSSLIVKDGYHWRKYGQKVTRDNPGPRAYFKCSFAPTCPVKKKVQRSIDDQSIVVATYEGEHNHSPPLDQTSPGSNKGSAPPLSTSPSSITLDLTKLTPNVVDVDHVTRAPQLQNYFVEQMVSTLTKDPHFLAALAAASTRKYLQHD